MGNCVLKLKGFGEREDVVKVVTSDGGIMELFSPITAECVTGEFPGHAIFKSATIFSEPLLHTQELHAGQVYYLLPLNHSHTQKTKKLTAVRSPSSAVSTPYRMWTCQPQNGIGPAKNLEVSPKYNSRSTGVWKVNLVITPEQLSEILSEGNRTEDLIENVRTVAKCGNGVVSAANSDQSSVSVSVAT